MRIAFAVLFALTATVSDFAAEPKPAVKSPLAEARQRLLKGNYAEARAEYEKFRGDEKLRPDAVTGIVAAWRAEGEYLKAREAIDAALKVAADNPQLLAVRADLLYDTGNWDEALKDAETAIQKDDAQFLARWVRARIIRDRGDHERADKEVRWFVRTYTALSNAGKDITDPDRLLLVGLAGAENARWNNLANQFKFILNEVYSDAIKLEPDMWAAEYHSGRMLLEKYNRPEAVEAFDKAIKINPNAAEPYVGKGLAAMQRYEFKEAEEFAELALKRNPKLAEALHLKSDVAFRGGDFPATEKTLLTAKAINPRDTVALGKLAACYLVQKKVAEFDAIVKQAESYDAKPGVFYFELAEYLEDRKLYAKAEEFFRKATELRPKLAGPRTSLGMLQLRMGQEAEGRKILDQAFKADPFNVRVSNMRKVMDHIDKYAIIKTAHYDVKYDPKTDKILAAFVAEYLEEIHIELKTQFDYEPTGRIPVELFSRKDMFAGRTIGLPDLHTIGACTGRVIVMASPHAVGVPKPFNWGRVMRHELVHIFNLTQTDFQCPHWLTEGLAVRNENMERPFPWMETLRERFDDDTLFNLDTVLMGFVRPRSPSEWGLAYCQSQIYVEYAVKTHGEKAIAKLLDSYRQGHDTAKAIQVACGVSKTDFEKGYRSYVEQLLKPYRSGVEKKKPDEKPLTYDELIEAQRKNPEDIELMAKLSEVSFVRGKIADARKFADAVLEKKKGHPTASVVKARLLARAGDDEAGREILEIALKAQPDDLRLLATVGRYYIEAKEFDKAAEVLEKRRKLAPLDEDLLQQLSRLYIATKNDEKLIDVLKVIVAHDPDEFDARIKLAKASLSMKKFADAELYARDAIQIDVMNEDARAVYLEALKAAGKADEAAKLAKRFAD